MASYTSRLILYIADSINMDVWEVAQYISAIAINTLYHV